MREIDKIPQFFREFFEKETQELNEKQNEQFAQFLTEFQDVFSEEIIARNCSGTHYKDKKIPILLNKLFVAYPFIYEKKSIKLSKK